MIYMAYPPGFKWLISIDLYGLFPMVYGLLLIVWMLNIYGFIWWSCGLFVWDYMIHCVNETVLFIK